MKKTKSFKEVNYDVMDDICSNLSIDYWAIYMALFRHCDDKTGVSCLKFATLAKETNLSVSTIQRRIIKLEEAGYIKHNSGKSFGKENINGQNLSNTYYFLTKDRNENVDIIAESMAKKWKKSGRKKVNIK